MATWYALDGGQTDLQVERPARRAL